MNSIGEFLSEIKELFHSRQGSWAFRNFVRLIGRMQSQKNLNVSVQEGKALSVS